ncbi:HNH endonuclease [Corynebacterium kutscheri]|uniref:HNH endonuclease n=1 Tax=Corynebacterium kutscheri TaxID=35755 RepID=UPI000A063E55
MYNRRDDRLYAQKVFKPPHQQRCWGFTQYAKKKAVNTCRGHTTTPNTYNSQPVNAFLTRDKHTCQTCGTKQPPFDIDHIDNTRGFGYDEDYNLQTLCVSCHKTKTQKEAAAGKAKKQAKLKRRELPHPGLIN